MDKEPQLPIKDEKSYAPFGEYGSVMISLEVGPNKKVFRVHAKRLLDRVPSVGEFAAKRKLRILGARTRSYKNATHVPGEDLDTEDAEDADNEAAMSFDEDVTLSIPEDDPVYSDMFLNCVYHDTIPYLKRNLSSRSGWDWDPFALYVLADELDIPHLKDRIMNLLQEGQWKARLWQHIKHLNGLGVVHYRAAA